MLIDETVVTFSEAAKKLPRIGGKRLHTSTLWRWARKGVKGVRLECRCLGGRFVTSLEALERFAQALAEIEPQRRTAPSRRASRRTESQRKRAVAEAERRLEEGRI